MAAAQKNKYAEKWQRQKVLKLLEQIRELSKKESVLYLGTALSEFGLYRHVWSYWKKKFKDDGQVYSAMQIIETVFEARLFHKALKNEINVRVAIFCLKVNHNWSDGRKRR